MTSSTVESAAGTTIGTAATIADEALLVHRAGPAFTCTAA